MQRFETFLYLPVKMGLLLSNWCNLRLHIATGLETKTFTRVYVDLKLLVNEEFVAYFLKF